MPEPIARAERFGYSYAAAGDTPVRGNSLRDVSFELEPGTFTVLAGISGSGKSTVLRALCGLVPHFYGGEADGEGLDVQRGRPSVSVQ